MLLPRSLHCLRDQKAWMEVLSPLALNSLGRSFFAQDRE
jgi:hypothetical protein